MPTSRTGALKDAMAALHGLLNVAAMTALAPGGVHHGEPPPNTASDYVVLQAPASARWDAMQGPGEQVFAQVAAVTFRPDYGQALAMVQKAIQLADGERPSIAGHLCVQCRWTETVTFRDPEVVAGRTSYRAVGTFELLVDQT